MHVLTLILLKVSLEDAKNNISFSLVHLLYSEKQIYHYDCRFEITKKHSKCIFKEARQSVER